VEQLAGLETMPKSLDIARVHFPGPDGSSSISAHELIERKADARKGRAPDSSTFPGL
jgi:hypothetical protein